MSYFEPPPYSFAGAPTATDDSTKGFRVGMRWLDTAAKKLYFIVDVTVGAAVWSAVGAAFSTLSFPSTYVDPTPVVIDSTTTPPLTTVAFNGTIGGP